MKKLTLLLLILMLAGCTLKRAELTSIAPNSAISQPIDSHIEPYNAQKVTTPPRAPWLLDVVTANYQNIPATVVLGRLVENHPWKLLFALEDDPLVSAPTGALTLQNHLAAVCSQANWTYTVVNGVILIFDFETKTFSLAIQPGVLNSSMPLNSLSTNAEAASGAVNTASLTLNPYENEITQIIHTVLLNNSNDTDTASGTNTDAPQGIRRAADKVSVTVAPSANAVIVTARPNAMRRIERVLDTYIADTAKSVSVKIVFYEVAVSNRTGRSLDLNIVRAAANTAGIRIFPTPRLANNASNLSFRITDENSKFNETAIVGHWLNTVGDTSVTFEDQVEIRNNTVATMNNTTSRQYVQSISREQTATGNTTLATPSVEFDILNLGWAISIQPTIIGNRITLNLAISRSNFVNEISYSFDAGRIAGTNFVTDNFNRRMAIQLQSGETKLLTSLTNQEDRKQDSRTPWLPGLGDRINHFDSNQEIVMMITATIQ